MSGCRPPTRVRAASPLSVMIPTISSISVNSIKRAPSQQNTAIGHPLKKPAVRFRRAAFASSTMSFSITRWALTKRKASRFDASMPKTGLRSTMKNSRRLPIRVSRFPDGRGNTRNSSGTSNVSVVWMSSNSLTRAAFSGLSMSMATGNGTRK